MKKNGRKNWTEGMKAVAMHSANHSSRAMRGVEVMISFFCLVISLKEGGFEESSFGIGRSSPLFIWYYYYFNSTFILLMGSYLFLNAVVLALHDLTCHHKSHLH